MKTIFNSTWVGNHICTEEATLSQLDGYNKTRYSRRKKKEGLLELASREAHERQAVYFATILNDDDSPYCAMESNVGYFGLDFLGNKYENYLLYEYREDEHSGKLFLKVITLFECYPGTTEKKIRIDFRYTKQGDYSSLLYQGESYDGTYEEIRTDYPPISAEERSWRSSGWTIQSSVSTTSSFVWTASPSWRGSASSSIPTRSSPPSASTSSET